MEIYYDLNSFKVLIKQIIAGLVMNARRSHSHVPRRTIFSLVVWISLNLFSINWPFRCVIIAHVTVAKSKIAHAKFFLYLFVNEELSWLISMFFQSWLFAWYKKSQRDHFINDLWDCGCIQNLSFLDQLQHRSSLK